MYTTDKKLMLEATAGLAGEETLQGPRSMADVIAAAFPQNTGTVDARFLWSRGTVHYFRVNWWRKDLLSGELRIEKSAFVAVADTREGLIVDRQPKLTAA